MSEQYFIAPFRPVRAGSYGAPNLTGHDAQPPGRHPSTVRQKTAARCLAGILKTCATLVLMAATTVSVTHAQPTQSGLPTQDLYAGMHRIVAEVAASPGQRAIGLMGRQSLPDNHGMLFVFEVPQRQCFWMEQTFVPLSIAFLKEDGTITNIEHMEPLSRTSHCSSEPVRLALEVNQGWFEQRNIKPGMQIRGLSDAQ